MDIFVARQPVFTAKKKVFGYELLFRNSLENVFPNTEGNTATSNLLSNTFFSFGLNEILAGKPGLINFTRKLIVQKTPLLFPKEHIIIKVLDSACSRAMFLPNLKSSAKKIFQADSANFWIQAG